MVFALVIFGTLSTLTCLFCVCLGVAASRADQATEAGMRAAGFTVPGESEILVVGSLGSSSSATVPVARGTVARSAVPVSRGASAPHPAM